MNQITRKLEFDAGHRLIGHESKCRYLHGHRYVSEITCQAEELDDVGRVIDFSVIKEEVGGWIDQNWDHNMILNSEDPLLDKMCWATCTDLILPHEIFGRPDPFVLPYNPTAENMAKYLFDKAGDLLSPYPIKVVAIRLWETPNCFADYRPGE